MFAVWMEYDEDTGLIFKVNKISGSDVRRKALPQMCPTVAETTFIKGYIKG